jgi:phosphatidate cytidylyltransferase
MTLKRIISALSLLVIFSLSFFNSNEIYFNSFALIICLIGMFELNDMLFKYKHPLFIFLTLFFLGLAFFSLPDPIFIATMSFLFWVFFAPIYIYKNLKLSDIQKTFFGIFLIASLFYSIKYLYENHQDLLLFSLLLVWIADSGAYFVGKTFGKHKLAPSISPGKTIEGAAGGLLLTILFSFLFADYFFLSSKASLFYAMIITFFSIFGDLFESHLKRAAELKDSGTIIPGHGGVLDRIDGICSSIPIIFSIIIFFPN